MSYKNYLIDMDGVLISGQTMIPGADRFIEGLIAKDLPFLVLTNNSTFTPGDLAHHLQTIGLKIEKERIYTAAMTTAHFLQSQKPNGKAFVIGESGLTEAIHDAGFILTALNPDYVVLGETSLYNFEQITRAVRLVMQGARFIATNPDATGPTDQGIVPACGAMAALIERATGRNAFYLGKPNSFMIRSALKYLGVHSQDTVMIGDRMDTDILTGIQNGMDTILVLSGVTERSQISAFPYQPKFVLDSVAEIVI